MEFPSLGSRPSKEDHEELFLMRFDFSGLTNRTCLWGLKRKRIKAKFQRIVKIDSCKTENSVNGGIIL